MYHIYFFRYENKKIIQFSKNLNSPYNYHVYYVVFATEHAGIILFENMFILFIH